MTALSKLHNKCVNCKYKNICDNKRMVACNLTELSQSNMKSAIDANNTISCSQPLAREYTPITINMGEYGIIETSLEEISEGLRNDLNQKLGIGVALK